MSLSDQQIAEIRYTTVARKIEAEQQLELVVLAGMDLWLNRVACLIVGQPGPALVADGEPAEPWVDRLEAATAAANEWLLFLEVGLVPQVGALFGEAFNQARRGDEFNPYRWQQDYMQAVFDRLKIWPADAFELLRPDLVEALADAATIDQVMNQIGDTLGISAESREHRAAIGELDRTLKDETLTPLQRARIIGERAQLWRAHDASLDEWEWKARRIARTEVQGAMESGNTAAARAWSAATGEQMWKQWLATEDGRTRHSHALASGQIVRLEEKFTVGGAHLDHPGEAGGPAHEVIQCRCTTLNLDADDVQDELQGARGSIGEIMPGGSRLGPDDPDIVAQKVQADLERRRAEAAQRRAEKNAVMPADVYARATPGGTPINPAQVRTYAELDEFKKIAPKRDADRYFEPHEKKIADFLRARKLDVRSVAEFKKRKGQDAVAVAKKTPIEFKTLTPKDGETFSRLTFGDRVEEIASKSRHGVVDARGTSLTASQAMDEIALVVAEHGVNLDELMVIVPGADGFDVAVSWVRGIV
ncbi:hypothetical protein TPB0596_12390 [Tsukamurella pulmonis]|uniref:phage minor head protein n=1 Tax=Tsukamurella pulmonis TaxID=47312 RepID=UPI001EDF3094|nr:phage minor head protein [Tsukamurella pulmonis]BDD81476.1 hypothetical protein TPB0596_12390 [Tsukamurella pulmonis]